MDVAKEEIVKTEELETRYERYKGILKDLTIMSDVFMRNVFKKRECTEYVLQVIMNKKVIIGNFKMNLLPNEVVLYIENLKKETNFTETLDSGLTFFKSNINCARSSIE